MLSNGLEICTCKKRECKCHGKCDECIEYHKTNKYHALPSCMKKIINRKIRKIENNKSKKTAPFLVLFFLL